MRTAAKRVRSFTCADQFNPVFPGSEIIRTPSAKAANVFALDLPPQGRFEAPLHTGDFPERAMCECSSTRASPTIDRPIDVRGGEPGAKIPHLQRNGERAKRKQGTARESTADLRSRARRTARDWLVHTGDKGGGGAR
jgi:hypothetical protein